MLSGCDPTWWVQRLCPRAVGTSVGKSALGGFSLLVAQVGPGSGASILLQSLPMMEQNPSGTWLRGGCGGAGLRLNPMFLKVPPNPDDSVKASSA